MIMVTFWNCVNLGGPAYITPSSVLLTVLPLFHTGGLNCYTNPVLHAGGTVLIMRAFDPGLALQLISDPAQGINVFFGVPSIYQFMAQHPLFETADFSHLIIGGVGGAPMPVPLLNVGEMRGVALQQGYGMTVQTSPAVLALDREDAVRKAGSSGKPVLHTEVRIVRPDGCDAAVGELGELWVKGPERHARLLEPAGCEPDFLHRRLAAYRRRHAGRRGRFRRRRRPLEGHVHFRRRERLPGRSRERAAPDRGRRGGRGDRRARSAVGRGRHGDRRGKPGHR